MDMSAIATLISTVGFPITCCIYLIYSHNKAEEKHEDELEQLRQTIDNNTIAMVKLCERLGVEYGKENL